MRGEENGGENSATRCYSMDHTPSTAHCRQFGAPRMPDPTSGVWPAGDNAILNVCGPPLMARRAAGKAGNPWSPGRGEGRGRVDARWKSRPRFTPWRRVRARHAVTVPLTGFVSKATRRRHFLSTRSCLGRINALRNGREASAGGTIRALERVPATFLEPGARPRIQRGKLR
jgi:hypothetical protein